jgi:hypothetical protein
MLRMPARGQPECPSTDLPDMNCPGSDQHQADFHAGGSARVCQEQGRSQKATLSLDAPAAGSSMRSPAGHHPAGPPPADCLFGAALTALALPAGRPESDLASGKRIARAAGTLVYCLA